MLAVSSACITSEPGPIDPRPTERPNGSSKLHYASGPMPRPILTLKVAPQSCRSGSIATTGIGRDLCRNSDNDRIRAIRAWPKKVGEPYGPVLGSDRVPSILVDSHDAYASVASGMRVGMSR